LLPWEVRRIEVAQRTQLATGDNQIASVYHNGLRVPAVYRVETKQVGQVLDVDEVIDRDQLHRWLVDNHLQDRASYSPQAVDGDFGAHSTLLTRVFSHPLRKTPATFSRSPVPFALSRAIVSSAMTEWA